MSRNPQDAPLPTATVEMTEIDGIGQGAILRFTDADQSGGDRELRTCYGDLYAVVNALRDYANMLEGVIPERGLTGYHAAVYELHAARCREIAGKYAAAIGYDYDKAMERCLKRRAKGDSGDDTGLDGLEALARKRRKPDAGPKKGDRT